MIPLALYNRAPSVIYKKKRKKLAFQLGSFFIRIYYFLFPWQKAYSGSQDTIGDI